MSFYEIGAKGKWFQQILDAHIVRGTNRLYDTTIASADVRSWEHAKVSNIANNIYTSYTQSGFNKYYYVNYIYHVDGVNSGASFKEQVWLQGEVVHHVKMQKFSPFLPTNATDMRVHTLEYREVVGSDGVTRRGYFLADNGFPYVEKEYDLVDRIDVYHDFDGTTGRILEAGVTVTQNVYYTLSDGTEFHTNPYFIPNQGGASGGGYKLDLVNEYPVTSVLPTDNTLFSYEFISYDVGVAGYRDYKIFGYVKKENINMCMSALGVPFTYDVDKAMSGNVNNPDDFPDYVPTGQPDDPTGGNDGDGDNTSDELDELQKPSIGISDTFSSLYALNFNEVNQVGSFMWTATFIDNIRLLFDNPAEGVISLRLYPFNITAHDGGSCVDDTVKIGNVETEITCNRVLSSYNMRFEFGTLELKNYWGSFLDYEPYTNIEIWLPYIGFKKLNTADVMGKVLRLYYVVDIITGVCGANIESDGRVLYCFEGSIGVDIPINTTNASAIANKLLTGAITVGTAVGGVVATGGIGGAVNGVAGVKGMAGAVQGINGVKDLAYTAGAMSALSFTNNLASLQNGVNKGGNSDPYIGFYQTQEAYVVIRRPKVANPSTFISRYGLPSNVSGNVGSFNGFLNVRNVNVDGLTCTENEKEMIRQLLIGGVYV